MNKKILTVFIIFVSIIVYFAACDDNDYDYYTTFEDPFTFEENSDTITTSTGLKYIVSKDVTGQTPVDFDKIVFQSPYYEYINSGVKYPNRLTEINSFSFILGFDPQNKGYDEIARIMNIGDKFRVIIPYNLGYGADIHGPIPPYSTLIYDLELANIIKPLPPFVLDKSKIQETASGLKYYVYAEGTGDKVKVDDKIKIFFRGYVDDNSLFSTKYFYDITFNAKIKEKSLEITSENNTIDNTDNDGFLEGLKLMNKGAKFILIIPPSIGYSNQTKKNIPPNSTLMYDIHLVDVN